MKETATIVFPDGRKAYEGELEDGFLNGTGTLFYRDGQSIHYQGEWRQNLPDGDGNLFFPDGSLWYVGTWKAGLREGRGKEYDAAGAITYDGGWKANHPEGQGIKYHPNGQPWYEGSFKAGEADGHGKAYYEDGRVAYDGQWRNGVRHGLGKLYGAEGGLEYFGPWRDGETLESEGPLDREAETETPIERMINTLARHPKAPVLSRAGELTVEIDCCLTPHFLPLSDSGDNWNPFVATLKQYESNPNLKYEDTALKGYYESYPRENLQQSFLLSTQTELKPFWDLKPHARFPMPWTNPEAYARHLLVRGFLRYDGKALPASEQNIAEVTRMVLELAQTRQYDAWVPNDAPGMVTNLNRPTFYEFGPMPVSHGEAIYRKLVWVYESVRTVGYLPGLYPGGRITGTVLLADDGYRFVADKGLFLLAALAALGYPQASATLSPETEGLIEREKIRDLPFVKAGVYPADTALLLFDHAFTTFKHKIGS